MLSLRRPDRISLRWGKIAHCSTILNEFPSSFFFERRRKIAHCSTILNEFPSSFFFERRRKRDSLERRR